SLGWRNRAGSHRSLRRLDGGHSACEHAPPPRHATPRLAQPQRTSSADAQALGSIFRAMGYHAVAGHALRRYSSRPFRATSRAAGLGRRRAAAVLGPRDLDGACGGLLPSRDRRAGRPSEQRTPRRYPDRGPVPARPHHARRGEASPRHGRRLPSARRLLAPRHRTDRVKLAEATRFQTRLATRPSDPHYRDPPRSHVVVTTRLPTMLRGEHASSSPSGPSPCWADGSLSAV